MRAYFSVFSLKIFLVSLLLTLGSFSIYAPHAHAQGIDDYLSNSSEQAEIQTELNEIQARIREVTREYNQAETDGDTALATQLNNEFIALEAQQDVLEERLGEIFEAQQAALNGGTTSDQSSGTVTNAQGEVIYTQAPAEATNPAEVSATCRPAILDAMKSRADAVNQRNLQISQSTITKPDSASQMVCLGEQFMAAASVIGSIFSDNPQFQGSCSIGSMSGSTIDAIANTMMFLSSAQSLGGGTLNINRDTVQRMFEIYAANTFSSAIGGAISSFLGGGCWAGIAGNLVSGAIDSMFGGDMCDLMDQVWSGLALRNSNRNHFRTLRELASLDNDPRQSAGAGGGPLPFTHLAATQLFADAIDVDASSLISNGTMAPANTGLATWGPRSAVLAANPGAANGGCRALPMFGPFITCNAGCVAEGSYPNWVCVPQ